MALWASLRGPLEPLGVEAIDAKMAVLAARADALDTLDEAALLDTARIARDVADALRALHARARSETAGG
jgi:hypothetical protein